MHRIATVTQPETTTQALHRRAVARVIEVLHERSEQPLTLEEMAEIALISPHHFVRVFHRLTGIPPVRYQWATRLAYAKRLLVETDMSVIDVCYEAGYNSLGSFTRRFTSLVGIPPHQFRLTARGFNRERLLEMVGPFPDFQEPGQPAEIAGDLEAPEDFEGFIFVGLFPADQTQGLPRACCVLDGPGSYRMASVPDGRYQLSAAGIPRLGKTADYFLHDQSLRASLAGGPLLVRSGRVITGDTRLELRKPEVTDLPILAALVPLFERKLKNQAQVKTRRPQASPNGPYLETGARPVAIA